jgi:capsular exopolysaccharide synthesis family protein
MTSKVRRLLAEKKGDDEGRMAVLGNQNSAYVEALRGLRTSLLMPKDGPAPKTILITSAGEQEGKSTLSLNLAALLVLNGSRVLLVDADMRNSGLSRYMGFARGEWSDGEHSGLSGALSSSEVPRVESPFQELPGLSAIPSGSAPAYPSELLGSSRMGSLVSTWAAIHDYVIIDSPPVLAVTDATLLSRLADTTILVARHGNSSQKSLERAYVILHNIEGRDVGIVVNDVHRDSVSFTEFYGYQGSQYYKEA